jgi:hypothetical protein
MSIGSLWRDLRSDFAQNTRGGKNTARCGAVISAVGVLVATFGAVGHHWFLAAACAVLAVTNAALARKGLRTRAARASAPSRDPA